MRKFIVSSLAVVALAAGGFAFFNTNTAKATWIDPPNQDDPNCSMRCDGSKYHCCYMTMKDQNGAVLGYFPIDKNNVN